MGTRVLRDRVAVRSTLLSLGVFRSNPIHRWGPRAFARAVLTPVGPGTVQFVWDAESTVTVHAWGEGGDWLLDQAPSWLGADDDPAGFDPSPNARLARIWKEHAFRLGGSGVVWQELLYAILGQRVTTIDAVRAWRNIVLAWGEPAPGPCELRLPPAPEVMAGLYYTDFHRFDVERSRATTIIAAAKAAARLEEAAGMELPDALRRLMAVSGIGPWTATSTLTTTFCAPDLVIERDYGLPTMVCWAFTGDATRQTDDRRMFELLEPFCGHRHRVVRLLLTAGLTPPRRAPRATNPRISRL